MGTRSLLGFENKKIYYQYLQFDGYPTVKGKDFYDAIASALSQCPNYFVSKSGTPNNKFYRMVKQYLDFKQYDTSHSFNNHGNCDLGEWIKLDCWQEWQYLWRSNGDFEIYSRYGQSTITIPWDFTWAIARKYVYGQIKDVSFGNFWEYCNKDNKMEPTQFQLDGNKLKDINPSVY